MAMKGSCVLRPLRPESPLSAASRLPGSCWAPGLMPSKPSNLPSVPQLPAACGVTSMGTLDGKEAHHCTGVKQDCNDCNDPSPMQRHKPRSSVTSYLHLRVIHEGPVAGRPQAGHDAAC